ncbi:sensor domain-containing diguanylate cyclase [Glaciimonas immobilis]|uniref:Diguanylate cyclase (GGDEF)-like protein/PAS domain S-box-containing protein n=1 Tax=Glaciimonas immobilis TaxID=728004 RepID=A0A840RPU4_9BURK|nr:sensor domain-containing diguanylate cyclase [Glaciimonas immobilis]KAF3999501.1 sensor domain-containing diguanylate cyclase [Glaciimonas immobilis]MBB5199026.1 diguanylate cyclase (GGDEF)-like protein/PAS domain S-box-containing protein [Glaciimonas immobilis]
MSAHSGTQDLAVEHEALLQFLYLAPVGLVQTSAAGEVELMNPLSAQLLMPLSKDGGLANLFKVLESVAPELRGMAEDFISPQGAICEGFRAQLTGGIRGKEEPKMLGISLIKLAPDRLMAVLTDMTQVIAQERQLKYNTAWLNAITAGVTDYALMSLDHDGRIQEWNPSIGRVTKFTAKEVVGKYFSVFYKDQGISIDRMTDYLREADEDGWSLSEGWRMKGDGSRFWSSSMIVPIEEMVAETGGGAPSVLQEEKRYALIIRDITARTRDAGARLNAMSTDYLTGIANRRTLFESAELELKRWHRHPRPLSLMIIDADFFKKVNDTYGHAAGDLVLCDLASALGESMREIDTVSRIGGEEFAALLPSTDSEGAFQLAERFRKRVEAACVTFEGGEIKYTISIGISVMDESVRGFDDLLARADTALYIAKETGRNKVEIWNGLKRALRT